MVAGMKALPTGRWSELLSFSNVQTDTAVPGAVCPSKGVSKARRRMSTGRDEACTVQSVTGVVP